MTTRSREIVFRGDNGWHDVLDIITNDEVTIIPGTAELQTTLAIPAAYPNASPTDNGYDTGVDVSNGQVVSLFAGGSWLGNNDWCHEYDLATALEEWVIEHGEYINGTGVRGTGTAVPNEYFINLRNYLSRPVDLTEVKIVYKNTRTSPTADLHLGVGDPYTEIQVPNWDNMPIAVVTKTWSGSATAQDYLFITADTGNNPNEVHKVTVKGSGVNMLGAGPYFGPEGDPFHNCLTGFRDDQKTAYALMYRIGESGAWQEVGKSTSFTATATGRLYLAMNDDDYSDNDGQMEVHVVVVGRVGFTPDCDDADTRIDTSEAADVLLYRIGGGSDQPVGNQVDFTAASSGMLQLTRNGCSTETVSAVVYVNAPDVPDNNGQGGGGLDCVSNGKEQITPNPIQLRTGVKVLSATDLMLNSPTQALIFSRHYNQKNLADDHFQFMGLAWSHNHMYQMQALTGTTPNREVVIYLPDGGTLTLEEDTTNHFVATSGSTAEMDYVNSEYVLTLPNRAVLVFEGTSPHKLDRREWPSGDTWSYTYDGSDNLTKVEDDYGRDISFTYYSGETGNDAYKNGQLKTITDSASRTVTLDYTPEKDNGTTIGSPKALLATVTDVLGEDWTYDYYGQHSGENVTNQLNLLTQRDSPQVDAGTADGVITLEELAYTMSGATITDINQKRGDSLLEADFAFQAGGLNLTEEVFAKDDPSFELITHHHFANGVYLGARDPDGNLPFQIVGNTYRPQKQGDANGNQTEIAWDTDGKTLQVVKDANQTPTVFGYDDADRLIFSLDAQERKTSYAYNADERQPNLIVVSDQEIDLNGGMEADSGWADVGTPSTNAQAYTQVDTGLASRHVETDAANEGIESAAFNLEADRTYILTARVYLEESKAVTMKVTGGSNFDVSSDTEVGVWQTLRVRHTVTSGEAGSRKVQFVAADSGADFYVDSLSVVIEAEIDLNGGMEADSGWTSVGTPTTNVRSNTQVDSGDYARHVITDAAGEGVESAAFDLEADHTYVLMARVYPVTAQATAQVKMKVSSLTDFDVVSTDDTAWETLRVVHTPTTGGTHKVQFLAETAACEFYVDSLHLLDVTNLLRWQEFIYDDKGRTLSEAVIAVDSGLPSQQTTRVYGTSGAGDGLLESVIQVDVEDAGNNSTTTYTYDSAGRVIKTQKSSLFGSCEFSYSVYDDAGNVLATVCGRESVTIPTTVLAARNLYDSNDPSKFTVTTHEYDEMGRRIKSVANDGNPAPAHARTSLTAYDALGRVIRTIDNYVADVSVPNPYTAAHSAFDHGTDDNENLVSDTAFNARGMVQSQTDVLSNVTLLGYDDAGRLVKTVQNASLPSYNNDYTGTSPDPDLSEYSPSGEADEDAITEQVYDPAGNLVQTVDALSYNHFTVYDALNRPVKTVRVAKDSATIDLNPGDTGYNAANDPRSSSYEPSDDPDRDLIDTTQYDALGRVIRTQRLLENRPSEVWDTTLYGYDDLGRQVKVVRHAATPSYDITSDPDLSAYTESSNTDEDIISTTTYDNQGRVSYPTDVNGVETRSVYDGLNRLVKTIQNYVAQGSTDPADWVWDNTDTRWERDDSGNVAVEHGSDNDQNIIAETVYDSDGRVQSTRDVLGRVTYTVYDADGRAIRRIQNYVAQGASDPKDWEWDSNDTRWEDGAGNAIARGSNDDQNIIADTVYDDAGRVQQTLNVRQNVTYQVYDDVTGRRVTTIANYVPQSTSDPADWAWSTGNSRWEYSAGQAVDHGTDKDQNIIAHTTYDLAGRVSATRDVAGIETRFEYDELGRRVKTIHNYVDGVFAAANPDEDLISETVYNVAGQVILTTDARGTQTSFTYDVAGRRVTVTQAVDTYLETMSYTCYDKAGRVLRTIQNYHDNGVAPDARDATSGAWLFNPSSHGSRNDRNLITTFGYDQASRRTTVTDPAGNVTTTTYFKDGQVNAVTDPEGVDSLYRYDGLRRRDLVVQNFVDNSYEPPEDWVFESGVWKDEAAGTAIAHATDNDQNIIVQVAHDVVGRMTSLRDPRGNVTSYEYDQLNRRSKLSNPLSNDWVTGYEDLTNGGTRTTMTYPGLATGGSYDVEREFDRLGRLNNIDYGSPTVTPDVALAYDVAGNRVKMTENDGTSDIRITNFGYDDVRRLTSVGFDNDGNGSDDETVSYAYDAGGLRTQMTLPGSKVIAYSYDARGRLIGLTPWDDQHSDFHYDRVGRHVGTQRANGLLSDYHYDAAGRLRRVRHLAGSSLRGQFSYAVDGRGNRIQALERVATATTVSDTLTKSDTEVTFPAGTWTDDGSFKKTVQFSGRMEIAFDGDEALLTIGTGPDHSLFDVYINGWHWRAFDGYASVSGEKVIHIPKVTVPSGETTGKLEIRNRADHNGQSSGYVFRFKQLEVIDTTYADKVIDYTYDGLSRLLEAGYDSGTTVYDYGYDLAGNLVDLDGTIRTYNAANQMTNNGTNNLTYDDNGNLTNDGVNAYTWDRANRMLTAPGSTSYKYDGLGNRIQQTVSSVVTDYLLDLQPGLVKVLRQADGTNTDHFIHAPRGIHAQYDGTDWQYVMQDGLGSVRGLIDATLGVDAVQSYGPMGVPDSDYGAGFGFTGEQTDANDLLFLRARYYDPSMGVFSSLDPFEGTMQRPMSLNNYSWVEGNIVNATDPTGRDPGGITYICRELALQFPGYYDDSLCMAVSALDRLDDLGRSIDDIFSVIGGANAGVGIQAPFYALSAGAGQLYWPETLFPSEQDVLEDAFAATGVCGRYAPGTEGSCPDGASIPTAGATPTPVPDISEGDAGTANAIWQDIAGLCNALSNTGEAAQPDTQNERRHVSFGLNDNNMLDKFTINLNAILNPVNIYVYKYNGLTDFNTGGRPRVYPSWDKVGLSDVFPSLSNFDLAFGQAVERAEIIHFNLEGIRGDYVEFANSSPGSFAQASFGETTATEMFLIKEDPAKCGKTIFYQNGSTIPIPSPGASLDICGFSPVPLSPGG